MAPGGRLSPLGKCIFITLTLRDGRNRARELRIGPQIEASGIPLVKTSSEELFYETVFDKVVFLEQIRGGAGGGCGGESDSDCRLHRDVVRTMSKDRAHVRCPECGNQARLCVQGVRCRFWTRFWVSRASPPRKSDRARPGFLSRDVRRHSLSRAIDAMVVFITLV